MKRGILETLLGAIVLVIALGFGGYVYSTQDDGVKAHYRLVMRFGSAQGLKTAAEVRLGGVQIGTVESIRLDPATLEAQVDIEISEKIRLPTDSEAEIATAGLLGENYINILPGSAETRLAANDSLKRTHDPVPLEDLLGRAIFALSRR